jgi:hypothetical protein
VYRTAENRDWGLTLSQGGQTRHNDNIHVLGLRFVMTHEETIQ